VVAVSSRRDVIRFASILALVVIGCDGNGSGESGDDAPMLPACVDVDPAGCQPLYEPTFDRVFSQTLLPRCGVIGGACHGDASAAGAAEGGLVLREIDEAHTILLGEPAFVQPSDAACSLLMVRVAVDDPKLRMPPGTSALPERELCSIAQWIEEGALR
jgi:hypothetical protein